MSAGRFAVAFLAGAATALPAAAVLGRRRALPRHALPRHAPAAAAADRAALKRLGMLAGSAPLEQLLGAVAEELARIVDRTTGNVHVAMALIGRYEPDGTIRALATWGDEDPAHPIEVGSRWPLDGDSVNGIVHRTGRAARKDDYSDATGAIGARAQRVGVRSAVCVPIVVDGALWGAATVSSTRPEPLPPDTEARAADFAELAATAISSAQAREQARRLSDEHSALRRIATLVAQGVDPDEVFRAVVSEASRLCGADSAAMVRYESADVARVVATWTADGVPEHVGGRWPLSGGGVGLEIARTRRPARIDDWRGVPGEVAAAVRDRLGYRCSVGTPVSVQGELWGMLVVHSVRESLPPDTERRLADFADLVTTSVSNASARAETRRLADEQAALRTMATLVARQPPLREVFAGVVEELGRLLDVEDVRLLRYDAEDATCVLAARGTFADRIPAGTAAPLVPGSVADLVRCGGRPARSDDPAQVGAALATDARETGVRSSVGSPILVGGRVWGALIASSLQPGPLSADTAERLSDFADLVATAIDNTNTRADLAASRARIVVATDEARRRFERDLHDGAQQHLVALALELRALRAAVPSQLAEVKTQLAGVSEGLDAVLDDLRELSRGIHPAILSEGGLTPALRLLARRSVVPVSMDVAVADRLAERVEVAAYYVISEALANVAKHAGAAGVSVRVAVAGSALEIAVVDDGVGGADPHRGSGLIGIIDRVEALGGTVRIVSPPGRGTEMCATLPLEAAE